MRARPHDVAADVERPVLDELHRHVGLAEGACLGKPPLHLLPQFADGQPGCADLAEKRHGDVAIHIHVGPPVEIGHAEDGDFQNVAGVEEVVGAGTSGARPDQQRRQHRDLQACGHPVGFHRNCSSILMRGSLPVPLDCWTNGGRGFMTPSPRVRPPVPGQGHRGDHASFPIRGENRCRARR